MEENHSRPYDIQTQLLWKKTQEAGFEEQKYISFWITSLR